MAPEGSPVALPPRVLVAGLGGDSGKTVASLAIVTALRKLGHATVAFKKGPDYIDAAWLSWASGRPARNLDTWLMGVEGVQAAFATHSTSAGIAIVEGNRGLYDGVDARGTHSSAELAKLLQAPVLLVVNATKVTRTLAACVLGCQRLDPGVRIAGVVLNRVNGSRHVRVIREAIEANCSLPVVGVIPRLNDNELLPGRHLGLVPPDEHGGLAELRSRLSSIAEAHLDTLRILEIAREAPAVSQAPARSIPSPDGTGLRIGYLRDSAFTFYYPENLEALESSGAALIPISSLDATSLPAGLHALYIGGGFPETHARRIAANRLLLDDIRMHADAGVPVYAECGGLMLLARSMLSGGERSVMAGVLPCDVELETTPQGHGYSELVVDTPNAFFPVGSVLRGHEFHYSRIVAAAGAPATASAVRRGTGSVAGRDGIAVNNVWAAFTHLHATATPEWAAGMIGAARAFASRTAAR